MTTPAIEARALVRSYGGLRAVDGIDLTVEAGELFGVLGPNGAGKSTLLGILTTILRPDSGSASVAGHDVVGARGAVRRNIGVVFQDPTTDMYLTVEENLRFHGVLYGMRRADASARITELLTAAGLEDRRRSQVRQLSGGLRRRLEIARALMHRPRVLFLDEPTVGLDPRARATVLDQVDALRQQEGTTIVLTTHYLAEADNSDRVAIVDQGRIVALDAPAALRAGVGPQATLDDVFLATTGRALVDDDQARSRADLGRETDRQRSGPR